MNIRILRNIFQKNDDAADENRTSFDEFGVTCFNLLGGAGSGKTTLLEGVIPILRRNLSIAVLEGDLATTRDAERIARLGVPVVQLLTEGGCHLNATLVQHALREWPLEKFNLVIIENVGNPICPANFDLGEHFRIATLSVTEGDDKPLKYPMLFKSAAAVVFSKCDLLPFVSFDPEAARSEIKRLNPNARIFETMAAPSERTQADAAHDTDEWDEPGTSTTGLRLLAEFIRSRCNNHAIAE